MSDTQYEQGYDKQLKWLTRSELTLAHARDCLAMRADSLDMTHPYNRGGSQATADYIAFREGDES